MNLRKQLEAANAEINRLQQAAAHEHCGRLLGAVLHSHRDTAAESILVAIELPDERFLNCADSLAALEYMNQQVNHLRECLEHAYDARWRENQADA